MLDDEEWHDYERVVQQCVKLVPPGVAYRKAEASRLWERSRSGLQPAERVKNVDSDQVIRYGARQVVGGVIAGQDCFEVEPKGTVPKGGPRKRIRLLKSRLPYAGWRKPEDVAPRMREILMLYMEGYSPNYVAEKLNIAGGSVRSNISSGSLNVGLNTAIPSVVINRMWELGLLPRMGPMTETDRRYIRDVREYPGVGPASRASRLGIRRDELDRLRRRLTLRFKVQHFEELEAGIVEGRINE